MPDRPPIVDALLTHRSRRPEAAATRDASRALTYGELADEVERAAGGLVASGVGPGGRVGLLLPNGVDYLVAALATVWAGATFVPLSVRDPPARSEAIIAECDPALVVGQPDGGATPAATRLATLAELAGQGATTGPAPMGAPAYIVFTSGTTGTPKGVVVGHRAFGTAMEAGVRSLGLGPSTRGLCVSPFHFDGSFATLFTTVTAGGLAVIPRRESLMFARVFVSQVLEHDIDFTGFSPTYLRVLLESGELVRLTGGPLRCIGLGGEALAAGDVRRLRDLLPDVAVYNRYGPTETTIAVTHHLLGDDDLDPGAPVPIGRPHPGTRFYLGAPGGSGPASNDEGELLIAGDQLMDGYWAAPAATSVVLRNDLIPGETVYRTGDLARRDGEIYTCLDRLDRVIKRRGVRLSLAEVSAALEAVPGVLAAAAVAYRRNEETAVAAFVVADRRRAEEVRRGLLQRLPVDMVPDEIRLVGELPLAASGKLDEAALLHAAGLGDAITRS